MLTNEEFQSIPPASLNEENQIDVVSGTTKAEEVDITEGTIGTKIMHLSLGASPDQVMDSAVSVEEDEAVGYIDGGDYDANGAGDSCNGSINGHQSAISENSRIWPCTPRY